MNSYSNLRTVSCSVSLSSCRLKAEALARALNNRIWPNTLINDCDVHSDEEIPQVTAEFNIARRSTSESSIGRAPQAHDIYNGQQKIIGHCYLNGMDEDEEYFDTPDCSPLPSPIEKEIIVNPPTHNGVPPFYTGPHYYQVGEGASSEVITRSEEVIDSVQLCEKLQIYSESMQKNDDLSETFYDVSEEEENLHDTEYPPDSTESIADPENVAVSWEKASEPVVENNNRGDTKCIENCVAECNTDTNNCPTGTNNNPSETNPIESSGSENVDVNEESIHNNPGNPTIGVQPASPLSPSPASDWTPAESESPTFSNPDNRNLDENIRLRRLQELEEEERPKLIRSTSLKTGKTPPGTPGQKKFVRFADAFGFDLTAVRHIVTDDIPNVPISAYTDLDLTEVEDSAASSSAMSYRVADRAPFDGSSTSSNWESVVVQGAGSGSLSLYPLFSPPSNTPDFLDRVRQQGVCLENIIVSDLSLHCICRVYNFSFAKSVTARYTTDEWQSFEEVAASYVPDSSDGCFDKFSFSLFLPHMQPNRRLQFAIRYVAENGSYWDSNNGENYVLRCHDNNPVLPSSEDSSAWIHHFY